jgi:hypothetical protein
VDHPEARPEATDTLRGLIDEITLIPVNGMLQIEATQNAKRSPETGDLSLQIASGLARDCTGSSVGRPRDRRTASVPDGGARCSILSDPRERDD